MAILSPHVTVVVLAAYVGKGRFAVPKNAPVLDVAAMGRVAGQSVAGLKVLDWPVFGVGSLQLGAGKDPNEAGVFATEDSDGVGVLGAVQCFGTCDAAPFLP